MLKDYYNEIIPPWDSRYGKLGHIRKRIGNNFIYKYSSRIIYYYIPPEMVLHEYISRRGRKFSKEIVIDFMNGYQNWTSAFQSTFIINYCMNLTPQEYYDLFIRNSNSKSNRPRCNQCHCKLSFNRLSQGYAYRDSDLVRSKLFCSNHCHALYEGLHPEQYNGKLEAFDNFLDASRLPINIAKRVRLSYLSLGSIDDAAVVYLVKTESGYCKYGVTTDFDRRSYMAKSMNGEVFYDEIILLESTRLECANLEATIKLKYLSESEYLPLNKYDEVLDDAKILLANRPINNPFE